MEEATGTRYLVQRDYGIDADRPWRAAVEKVTRRTPYMREWGDGSTAATAVEASAAWLAAKRRERKTAVLSRD